MAGLLIVVLTGVYVWVAYRIVRWIQPKWGKVVAGLFFISLVSADAIYGRIKLDRLCKEEGGLRTYRTAQNVDGFHSPFGDESLIRKYGYSFVETGWSSPYMRYEKTPGGVINNEKVSNLKSRYAYHVTRGDLKDVYLVTRFQIVARPENEVLAEVINFNYAGGWVERTVAGLIASRPTAGTCNVGYPERVHEQLITRTLNPSR